MPFLNNANTTLNGNEDEWILDEPLHYVANDNTEYVVPKGYISKELASIPRLPLMYVWMKQADTHRPGILHDYLCTQSNEGKFKRSKADAIFFEALRSEGVEWIRAKLMWAAVRSYGAIFG